MKNMLTFSILTLCFNMYAQYDVNIKDRVLTNKERQIKVEKSREEKGGCKFIPFHDYTVGMKFYFPKDDFKIQYDSSYDKYYGVTQVKKNKFQEKQISYKDVSGKIFEIIKIEERKVNNREDSFVTLKQVDSSFIIEHKSMFPIPFLKSQSQKDDYDGQVSGLPDLVYTGEIDSFKEKYLDKELYSLFLVNGKRFKKIKIIEVGAGSENKPIRAVVLNENGNREQIDFCSCGTNVPSVYSKYNSMEYFFSSQNPQDNFKGRHENWELICEKKIAIGFTEYELRFSLGGPNNISETVTEGKKRQQFIYSDQYVYLENGIVTSFQSSR